MTGKTIIAHRLKAHQLTDTEFTTPEQVVGWLGAVQAQDHAASLWAIGCRIKGSTEKQIEAAIEQGKIVRSWPMRGTLHLVAAEDLRWMLQHLTPRVVRRTALLYKQAELDDKVFAKSRKIFVREMERHGRLSRPQMYELLESNGIKTGEQRGLHLIGYHAQTGLICFSGKIGKQPSFSLLEQWIKPHPVIGKEEAFAKVSFTYFRSHGPATIEDLMWWSGLTKKESLNAIQSLGSELLAEKMGDKTYYFTGQARVPSPKKVLLLPPYDEYAVAYKNRSEILSPEFSLHSGNGIFSAIVLVNGKIQGTWKRSVEKGDIRIETTAFRPFSTLEKAAIQKQIKNYRKFLGLK
jgi:hypothetical protein